MRDMQRTRIKICGITTPESAQAAARAGADAVGLVFVPGSPRNLSLEMARDIAAALPAFVEPVGLFVNAGVDAVRRTADALRLRTVQLHGDETPRDVLQLAPLRVLKSIAFESRHVSEQLATWRNVPNIAGVLFDAPPPSADSAAAPAAADRGGTGRRFDWEALARLVHAGVLRHAPPLILAGGLKPDNVAEAIATLRPYAVDVSSGVESSRGVKDTALISTFCRAVQEADLAPNISPA
jgi:phosphoribosylanthranilate isomerase